MKIQFILFSLEKMCFAFYWLIYLFLIISPLAFQVEYKEMDERLAHLSEDDNHSDDDKKGKEQKLKPQVAPPAAAAPASTEEPLPEEESENEDPTGQRDKGLAPVNFSPYNTISIFP